MFKRIGVFACLFFFAACSSKQAPLSSLTPTPSASASGAQITDARATRDKLLEIAKRPGAFQPGQEPEFPAWTTEFPGIDFAGAGIAADPQTVSGFVTVTSKTKSVDYLAFAVMDTAGMCSGGIIDVDGSAKTVTKTTPVDQIVSPCTGSAVSDSAGY